MKRKECDKDKNTKKQQKFHISTAKDLLNLTTPLAALLPLRILQSLIHQPHLSCLCSAHL